MKKVLIIGAAGYLGSKLFFYLQKKPNLIVHGSDNLQYSNTFLKKVKKPIFKNIDIRDIKNKDLENYDVVICLSALSNNPIDEKNKKKIYDISKVYTENLAEKISKIGNKLIFPSSCSVYGYNDKICNEKTKTNPKTFYSKNKIEIEESLKRKKINCIILRPATVFGVSPSIRFDLVINMLIGMSLVDKKILLNSNGLAKRPFIYIDDLCEFFYRGVIYNDKKFLILNAGNNHFNYSIIEVAKKISKISKKKIIFGKGLKLIHKDDLIKNAYDERSYNVNFDLARNELKLKYKNNFDELIYKTYLEIREILKRNNFNSKNFYRLNKIRYLINRNYINEKNLRVK